MDDQNIGGFGGYSTSDPSLQGIAGTTPAAPPATPKNTSSISTIQESELEALIYLLAANLPILTQPASDAQNSSSTTGISSISSSERAGSAAVSTEDYYQSVQSKLLETKHQIISAIWDTFLKNIKEMGEQIKEEERKKWLEKPNNDNAMDAIDYLAYLVTLTASEKIKAEGGDSTNALAVQFQNAFNDWIIVPSGDATNSLAIQTSHAYPSMAFIAGCLACSSGMVRDSIGTGANYHLSMSPVADALNAGGPASGLPGDAQAAAALIAALLYNGAVYKASLDTVQGAAAGGKPPQDLDFAVNYAKIIMSIVTHSAQSSDKIPPERASQNQLVRLLLTSMALNLLYRAGYGGMTGQELADLLEGHTDNVHEAIKPLVEQLLGLIKGYLPTDPMARQQSIARLMEYVDKKYSVDSMLETTHLFSEVLATSDVDRKRLEELEG